MVVKIIEFLMVVILSSLVISEVCAGSVQLNSSATVTENCSVVAPSSLPMGQNGAVASNASSLIDVACSSGSPYSVGFTPVSVSAPASGVSATGVNPVNTSAVITY
jgi:spore coat protein U-like protein